MACVPRHALGSKRLRTFKDMSVAAVACHGMHRSYATYEHSRTSQISKCSHRHSVHHGVFAHQAGLPVPEHHDLHRFVEVTVAPVPVPSPNVIARRIQTRSHAEFKLQEARESHAMGLAHGKHLYLSRSWSKIGKLSTVALEQTQTPRPIPFPSYSTKPALDPPQRARHVGPPLRSPLIQTHHKRRSLGPLQQVLVAVRH